jgi:uncharacterized protein with HEPN domain
MTLRDRRAFLWDMLQAARSIKSFVAGKTLEDYQRDDLLRSGVERQFLIIGEALSQATRLFPDFEEQISDASRIIAFRNRLVHGYASVADDVVWAIVQDELPRLGAEVEALLQESKK